MGLIWGPDDEYRRAPASVDATRLLVLAWIALVGFAAFLIGFLYW